MNINILCVGKIKEKFYTEAIAEYKKRLSKYCKLSILEVADEKTEQNMSSAAIDVILKKEADRLKDKLKDKDYIVALDIQGDKYDSLGFSRVIDDNMLHGTGDMTFIIGGSMGLHDSVLDMAHMRLSFSDMTFPHQLMRVILLEQIYRAYKIIRNEPYHK